MYNITKIPQIIVHLKNISSYYKESNKELILFCQYCDDGTRQKANHGHLYISKTAPVFHCFRCNSSGNLIRFLIDTGFEEQEILNHLSQFIKYKTIKDYYKTKKKTNKLEQIQTTVINKNLEFKKQYRQKFEIYETYLNNRIGNVDYSMFLISPTFYYNNLSCLFTNCENENILLRLIEPYKDIRYHINQETSKKYYFQEKDLEKYSRVTLAEGPFDIINLYLYNPEFKDSYFVSLNSNNYNSTLEHLILEDFLITDLQIDLVFDNDVKNYKTRLYRAKLLAKQYNQNIQIKGWKAMIGKDPGEFPVMVEV